MCMRIFMSIYATYVKISAEARKVARPKWRNNGKQSTHAAEDDGISLSMIVRKIRLDRCAGQDRQKQKQGLDKGGLTAALPLQDAGIQAFLVFIGLFTLLSTESQVLNSG